MRTNLSNCTREEFVARVREVQKQHEHFATLSEVERQAALAEEEAKREEQAMAGVARLAEVTGDHTLIDLASHWAKAVARWTAAGWPVRTDEEVLRIVAICQTCADYAPDNKSCKLCGCKVKAKGMAIKNKAKMKTETCSKGKWPATSHPSPAPS